MHDLEQIEIEIKENSDLILYHCDIINRLHAKKHSEMSDFMRNYLVIKNLKNRNDFLLKKKIVLDYNEKKK